MLSRQFPLESRVYIRKSRTESSAGSTAYVQWSMLVNARSIRTILVILQSKDYSSMLVNLRAELWYELYFWNLGVEGTKR